MFKLDSNTGQNRLQRDKVCRVDIGNDYFLSKSTKCDEGVTQDTAELINYSNNVYEL